MTNINGRFIYIRSLKQKFPCTEEQFQAFYKEVDRIRHREQDHSRCKCPKKYIWACDGDCENCEHHINNGPVSLDEPQTDDGNALADILEDTAPLVDQVVSDRILLEQLFARLHELDPEADTIIRLWQENPEGISDRAIARELGRPQKTFADQMKKYRTDLRRIRSY